MKLFEILNTKPKIVWVKSNHEHRGTFFLRENKYVVHIDEYELDRSNKTLLDIGFDTNGFINAIENDFPAANVIGAVSNSIIDKLEYIKFDIIMLSALNSDPLIDSRKKLYKTLSKRFTRTLQKMYWCSDFIVGKTSSYMFISDKQLSDDEILEIQTIVKVK